MVANLQIDDKLIIQATKLGGHPTKKAAVTKALTEYIRHQKQEKILSWFGTMDYNKQDQSVVLRLTQAEIDLIRDETFYDANFGQRADRQGSKRIIRITPEELENLIGYVAAEANHSEDKALARKLDKLFEKLDMIQERYRR